MKRSEYQADSVIFTNKQFFSEPLYGILKDKVMNIKSPEFAAYPRFDSYSSRFIIKNLFDDVDYNGSFSMRGARFIGTGTFDKPAQVNIYRDIEIIELAFDTFTINELHYIRMVNSQYSHICSTPFSTLFNYFSSGIVNFHKRHRS